MADGPSVSRNTPYQAPVHDAGTVDATKPTDSKPDVKTEAQPAPQPRQDVSAKDASARKLEQSMNGTVRQAQLSNQLRNNVQPGESLKTAQKILDNPKLSDEAKIAQLQKTIVNTDKAEFKNFMAKYPSFSDAQKALINSAITESPKIMERVAGELNQSEQLTVVWNGLMNGSHGKTPAEESKRQERTDKAMLNWMQNTDRDTLNKALYGRDLDIRASGKLYAALASNPTEIMQMVTNGRLDGDQSDTALAVMNMAYPQSGNFPTHDEIEKNATALIFQQYESALKMQKHPAPPYMAPQVSTE